MLTVTTAPDLANGLIVVTLRGLLALDSAPVVRTALLKALADGPDAVLVDVRGLSVDRSSRLTIFPAALRVGGEARSGGESTAVLLLFGPSAELAALMNSRVLGPVTVYGTAEQAVAAAASHATTARRRLTLGAEQTAPARARALVASACHDWQVDHLRGPATQIVSELVANAVRHAGTGEIQLAVSLRGAHLYLSVRDRSTQPPVPAWAVPEALAHGGRGLFLVDLYATAWGCNTVVDGKTVWASLRATPVTA
ncbi:STAS domain-containing protein [Phytohabitans aurantiacus]|uniref:STAS domain-containing protein n=1 Tax=Phytohabitans aurantiacus TaxID=3016789 RepID=A0ABQ5R344_9ACTN|nr:STAS domain-containing protein [Phytohabitans aurantiacus]